MPLSAAAAAGPVNRSANLATALAASIDSRISGLTPSTTKPIFVGYNSSTPVSARNSSCWLNGVSGITSISSWNSAGLNFYGGVLVASDTIILANHAYLANGTTVDTITTGGTRVTRSIVSGMRVGSTDIYVAKVTAFPGTITCAKVFSADAYADFKRAVNYGGVAIPVVYTDTSENALVADISSLDDLVNITEPSNATRLGFFAVVSSGASGGPICVIYNGELVVLTTFLNPLAGPSINENIAGIRAAMETLGCVGTLTEITI